MYLPVAHGEGKFIVRDQEVLEKLRQRQQLALRYVPAAAGEIAESLLPFPVNPNGSMANVAGACDETGRVFGLMPHPERHLSHTNHPRWTRGEGQDPGDGLAIFRNAVRYFA
jgi:phosphoribosylformylglycinamidine synthase